MVKLIFLHGIRYFGSADGWQASHGPLGDALSDLGYPKVDFESTIAPSYGGLLDRRTNHQCPPSPQTVKEPTSADHDRQRWDYARRQAALERLLKVGGSDGEISGVWEPAPDLVAKVIGQARRYLGDEKLRDCVLRAILNEIPPRRSGSRRPQPRLARRD